ncbi:MAG: hypothetical protein V3U31_07580 [Dehalococcoidia bacterium]
MWVEIKRVSSLMAAEMWRELLQGESIPTLVLPEVRGESGEFAHYRILVPKFRETVVAEVLRKL